MFPKLTLDCISCWSQVRKPVLTAAVALFCCLLGLVFTTGAGEYWLTLFDTFGATGTASVILQK